MSFIYDVAIVGAGPAGLSAALLLGRSRRRIIVFDHGQPRNGVAAALHGYLGLDGIKPAELRELGRRECTNYGAEFVPDEVTSADRLETDEGTLFKLSTTKGRSVRARKVLMATGVRDRLPEIPSLREFYGRSVHHCPYCDGWEHRDERLVALGDADSVGELAMTLRIWSTSVAVCTNGQPLADKDRRRLECCGVTYREPAVTRLAGAAGKLTSVVFETGSPLDCDALFFSAGQVERSNLPALLGCRCDEEGKALTQKKQGSGVPGVFIAGDADGDVQFAIVAAAEGAIAATAINMELLADTTAAKEC
jgi:thioredoxin reductase